jgi:photosystem II stability/assembly factor-like uncharacterized protein
MSARYRPLLPVLALVLGCAGPRPGPEPLACRFEPRPAPAVRASLRGLAVVSTEVVWASGTEGTVVSTTDGGRSWRVARVAGAAGADLRSIHAFDAEVAVVATAGQPARILRTADGGATWDLVHEVADAAAFLDSLRFADRQLGYAFGDPLGDGAHFVLRSEDGGRSFARLARTPAALPGEAGFAASGSCIDARGGLLRIGTGGGAARLLRGIDAGEAWEAVPVPILQGAPSQGIFALAFADARHGLAVGGDHLEPDRRDGTAAFTADGGATWETAAIPPTGFRSGAAFVPAFGARVVVAVGTNGADLSRDGGRTFAPLPGVPGHHAIAFAPGTAVGWAVGAAGRIARVTVERR